MLVNRYDLVSSVANIMAVKTPWSDPRLARWESNWHAPIIIGTALPDDGRALGGRVCGPHLGCRNYGTLRGTGDSKVPSTISGRCKGSLVSPALCVTSDIRPTLWEELYHCYVLQMSKQLGFWKVWYCDKVSPRYDFIWKQSHHNQVNLRSQL